MLKGLIERVEPARIYGGYGLEDAGLFLPVAIGLFVRYSWNCNDGLASIIVIGTAIFVGSLLMAYGSYYQTFIAGAKGILVGHGWNSVGASSIVGGIAGAVFGFFSILVYSIVVSIVRISTSSNSPDRK